MFIKMSVIEENVQVRLKNDPSVAGLATGKKERNQLVVLLMKLML